MSYARSHFRLATVVASLALWIPSLAVAQGPAPADPPTPAPAPTPVVTPPTIETPVEPVYPEAAIATARGRVVANLRVVIEIDGSVSAVTVLEPLGDGLDEAAVTALRAYRFTPAMRDGQPIRIAIRFQLSMEPPVEEDVPTEPEGEPEPVEPEAPPPGRIAGQLLDAATDEPLADVDVAVVGADGAEHWTRTDAEGRFAFEGLLAGEYRVIVRPLGLPERAETETVAAGEELAVTYRLQTTPPEVDEADVVEARAVADPPPREAIRRTIPREVLNMVPGTRGDPLRAIEILPGIARPPFGLGLLIIRGSAPGDSEYLFSGVPIPGIYHFGGLTSVINGRLLQNIDFFPGNFSSRYGRKMGGIVEIETRDPQSDRIHGNIETSVIDTSILLEGPIGSRFSIAGSFRRSLIDLVLAGVLGSADVNVVAAPVYYDYQLFGTWRPTDRDRVRFRFYGSDDRFRAIVGAGGSDDPALRGGFGLSSHFDHFQTNWDRQINAQLKVETVALFGPTMAGFNAGTLAHFDIGLTPIVVRNEWTWNPNDHVRVIGGTDIQLAWFDVTYRGPALGQSEGETGDNSQERVSTHESGFGARPGAYLESSYTRGPAVITGALRFDYYSEIKGWSLDPRLITAYRVHPQVTLRAAAGLYSQPPEFQESSRNIGNPNLDPLHSAHFGAGVAWAPSPGISLTVDGFYKQLWNRVVTTDRTDAPPYENGGIGRIYGLEVAGRIQPATDRPYFGYVSYTLMRSERRDHPGDPFRLFDFDQTHIFTGSFSYTWNRHHWSLGGTLRLVSGNPYTPVDTTFFDPQTRNALPYTGVPNSARNPLFNRFDVRVEKQWWFSSWKLALFLDVQNVYNQHNQEFRTYNYDYSRSGRVTGLPIIPGLGLRGEF